MASTVNVQFNDQLRRYIDSRTSEDDVYATPSEYIRDLVRRDMEQHQKQVDYEIAEMLLASMDSKAKAKPYNKKTFVTEHMQSLRARKMLPKKARD